MAKQQPDDAPKKTQISKKTSQPTQISKKSAQPTMLSPDESHSPDSPPPPQLSLDDEVIEAEAADSGVVEAQPVSDVAEALSASDVVEAEAASDVAHDMIVDAAEASNDEDIFTADEVKADQDAAALAAPETPVRAEQAEEAVLADEDAVGGESPRNESSVHAKGMKLSALERTEMLEPSESSAHNLDQTVAFEADVSDDSSAVDLGRRPLSKGSSHGGVDEVAEALESGVNLEAIDSPMPRRRPEPSVEFDDLVPEEGAKPSGPASSKSKMRREDATDPDVLVRAESDDVSADELLSEEDLGGKSVDESAAELWGQAGDDKGETAVPEASKSEPAESPSPAADKGQADEGGAIADSTEPAELPQGPTRRKRTGGGAVMTKPRKPKYGRRWLGGMLVGILLAAGALVGLRYYDPDLLEPGFALLPEAKQPKAAIDLKAAQENVKRARADLDAARTEKVDLEKVVESKTDENKKLSANVASLAASAKSLTEVRDLLVKKKLIQDKADLKEVAKVVGQALAAAETKEKLVQDIEKFLVEAKQLTDKDKLDLAAVGKIVKDLGESQAAVTAVNKVLDGAKIKETGDKGVQQLLSAREDLAARLSAVNKLLTEEKIKSEGATGLKEIVAVRNRLQKDRDELDKAVKDAYKELAAGQFAPDKGDPRQQLLAGAKNARQRAESPLAIPLTQLAAKLGNLGLNPAGETKSAFAVASLLAELNFYRLREPLIQSPEQKLDAYLAIYRDRNRGNAAEQAAALKDAAWVLSKDAKAAPQARAKAQAVIGLVRRNQENYAEARNALQAALATPVPEAGAWLAQTKQALQELTDPAAFYLPRVDQLQGAGQFKAAQQELAAALKAMPNDARLLAQRGLLRLEEIRSSGTVSAQAQAAIRQDAEVAAKNPKTAADGAFVLGMLEEELGNYARAEQLLRQALKSHQGSAEEAARIRIALARVLQRDRAPVAAPAPKKEDKKAADAPVEGEVSQAYPLAGEFALGQPGTDDEDNPAATARLSESIKLARELIDSTNPKIKGQGYMLLGQALAKQGQRTEGIREYLKGMEMLFPGMASKDMAKLLEEHPAFQQPDAAKAPSAYLAEVQFGKGLQFYWTRQYPQAEVHFKQAAGFYSHDARYQYFLGLAQYAQKSSTKRDAAVYSFEQGAKLEAANRPPVSEVNSSLERIQGDLRKLINTFRAKAIELPN